MQLRLDVDLARILDGVVDEIGDGLPDQVPVGVHDDVAADVDGEAEARLLRHRLVKLGHVAYELARGRSARRCRPRRRPRGAQSATGR